MIDVGGGHKKDTEQHSLSNISLRWMVQEILNTSSHILFDETELKRCGVPGLAAVVAHTRETSDSTMCMPQETPVPADIPDIPDVSLRKAGMESATPEPADALDAVQGVGDQLRRNLFWWALEFAPTNYVWQNEQGEWVGGWSINWGRGRRLPSNPRPLFHESVRTRLRDPSLSYIPAARYKRGIEEYVV